MKTLRQVIVFSFFILVLALNILPFLSGNQALLDFGSFYASGLQMQNGRNPYSPDSKFVLSINYRQVGAGGKMVNLNPPISAMIFRRISQFDPEEALSVWQLLSIALYGGLIFLMTSYYRQNATPTLFIWAFTIAGFWQTVILGQIYIFLLPFVVLGWILIQKKKYVLGGVALGLMIAFKPNFIIWAIFLLVSGYWVVFLSCALTGLLVSLIPFLLYGPGIYQQWLAASTLRRAALVLPGNSSVLGLTARFDQLTIGLVIGGLLVCLLLYLAGHRKSTALEDSEYISTLGIIASLLASPFSWVGYTLFLVPAFFSLQKWNYFVTLAAAIFCFPFLIILWLWQNSFANFVIFGWSYGWGILCLLAGVIYDTLRRPGRKTELSYSTNQ